MKPRPPINPAIVTAWTERRASWTDQDIAEYDALSVQDKIHCLLAVLEQVGGVVGNLLHEVSQGPAYPVPGGIMPLPRESVAERLYAAGQFLAGASEELVSVVEE